MDMLDRALREFETRMEMVEGELRFKDRLVQDQAVQIYRLRMVNEQLKEQLHRRRAPPPPDSDMEDADLDCKYIYIYIYGVKQNKQVHII